MAKHTFEVTENMRRVTRYEVDDADLTPELADLMERLNEDGDLTEEEDYLVNRLVAAAGDQDHGEVMDIFLADDAEYALSIVTEAEAASLGDIEDESTRRFFTERGVNLEEDCRPMAGTITEVRALRQVALPGFPYYAYTCGHAAPGYEDGVTWVCTRQPEHEGPHMSTYEYDGVGEVIGFAWTEES